MTIGPVRLAPEGLPIVLAMLGVSLTLVRLVRRLWWPLVALNAFALWFFRDPRRTIPPVDDHTVIAPADGKVVAVEEFDDDPELKQPVKRLSIFLSLTNVHVQRAPIRGKVLGQRYNPGEFKMAFHEKASELNEQMMTLLGGEHLKLKVVQIAGYVARRIICHVRPGDECRLGDRIGIIRFGSRVDLTMPRDVILHVAVGDHVVGGETVIGHLP